MEVQTVKSPGGIKAWLVEDYAVPTFALRFAFEGGSSQDPGGKEGLTNFVTLMLGQGAGDMSGVEFQRRIENLAIRVAFEPGADAVMGSIEALSETWSEAAELVGLALTRPLFDAETIERARRRLVSFNGDKARTPRFVADAQWNAVAFAGHAYAHEVYGSEASVNRITAEDLRCYCARIFAKDRLKVVAVGDITVDELGKLLDRVFGALPATADLLDVPPVNPVTGGRLRVAEMDVSQSTITFGMGAVAYDSPDFIPAHVLNHIVGGDSGVPSRLSAELRHKHGLAYSVGTWSERRPHAVVFKGLIGTRNDMVGKLLELLRYEMQKMADGHISQQEFDDAKSYLTGVYLRALGSNSKIAMRLLDHAMNGFGPDYVRNRKGMIASVGLDQLKAVARYMLDPENLIISIAGTPALQPARKS